MKLFIHRYFGGSAHPKVLFVKGKQWNYPRLANTVVTLFIAVAILHAFDISDGWLLASRIGWGVVLVALFLYTALNPLSLKEWYWCYWNYWLNKGYWIMPFSETEKVWEIQTPDKNLGAVDFENAISVMYFEIYGKWPMRV